MRQRLQRLRKRTISFIFLVSSKTGEGFDEMQAEIGKQIAIAAEGPTSHKLVGRTSSKDKLRDMKAKKAAKNSFRESAESPMSPVEAAPSEPAPAEAETNVAAEGQHHKGACDDCTIL